MGSMGKRFLRWWASYFLPHESNNQRAGALHHHWLLVYLVFFLGVQLVLTLVSRLAPGILGYATNINAESLLSLTNQKRLEQGIGPLTLNPLLAKAAYEKGVDMMEKDYWSHTSPEGLTPWYWIKNNGYVYTYAGENLARDFNDSSAVVEAFMRSPTHRENILNSNYQDIGLAVIDGNFNGLETTLVVQLFGAQVASKEPVSGLARLKAPEIQKKALAESGTEEVTVLVAGQGKTEPKLDVFEFSRKIAFYTGAALVVILAIDEIYLHRRGLVRTVGYNLGHLVILMFFLLALWLLKKGAIL